ncbi:MAG: choice-of-anchor I family protein [Halonotius sp.]
MTHLGRYSTGVYDDGAAEIPAYDPGTQQLFVVNGSIPGIDVLDVSDPTAPTQVDTIETGGSGPNNVSVHNGTVAAAVEAENTQTDGYVSFYSAEDLSEITTVSAGPLPDMVTFAADGNYVLTANEGEPNDDYSTDPAGSVSVIDISNGISNATVNTASFTPFDGQKTELRERGIRLYGNDASVSEDLEPEYIATAGTTAYVTLQENNALAIVDIEAAEVTELQALGYKDHSMSANALDAVDDDTIDITTQPIYGMYQPDAIEAYETDGETYLVAANEGDAREYAALFETGVLKQVDGQWGLDATEDDGDNIDVPVAASEFEAGVLDSLAGLEVTTEYGDTNDDGVIEELYLFGARSYSIHDSDGTRLYESGDELEQLVATEQPAHFNSDDDENGRDSESVASGPEPEGVAVGDVNGTPHAFIGLEEISAITTFNVSDPNSPSNVDYTNTRNFDIGPEADIEEGSMAADAAGDLSPEGLAFIPAADSPVNEAMLAVSYEVSGTTSLYSVATEHEGDTTDSDANTTQSSTGSDTANSDNSDGSMNGDGTESKNTDNEQTSSDETSTTEQTESANSTPGFGTLTALGGLGLGSWLLQRADDENE